MTVTESESSWRQDLSKYWGFCGKYSIVLILALLILFAVQMRVRPYFLDKTDDWARSSFDDQLKAGLAQQVEQEYPNLGDSQKNVILNERLQQFITENKAEYESNLQANAAYIKDQLRDPDGWTYLSDIDTYYWLRQAHHLLTTGHIGTEIRNGEYYDMQKIAPEGQKIINEFHPYVVVFFYSFLKFFGLNLMAVLSFLPVILGALLVLPTYFLIKRLTHSNIGAIIGVLLVSSHAAILGRSIFGNADTDIWVVVFPIVIAWLLVESFANKSKWCYILMGLTGISVGMYAFTWGGWWFTFDLLLGGMIAKVLWDFFRNKTELKKDLLLILVFLLLAGITTTILQNFNTFITAPFSPLNVVGTVGKDVAETDIFPRIHTTVAELAELDFQGVINQAGGKLFVILALLGAISLFIREHKYFGMYLLAGIGVGMYASTWGVRFLLLLIPLLCLGVGILAGSIIDLLKNVKGGKIVYPLLVFVVVLLMVSPVIKSGNNLSKGTVTMMNDAWYDSLTNIRDNSDKNAIITSWWDFGHWFITIAERGSTFDGSVQRGSHAFWVGKLLSTNNDELAIGILRMLDCGSNFAYVELQPYFKHNPDIIHYLEEFVQMKKEDAYKSLESKSIPQDKINKILELTHCNPPESFVITSSDMIGKAQVWSHFGGWNFDKAQIYLDTHNLSPDDAVRLLKEKYVMNQSTAEDWASQATTADPDSWISGWWGYGRELGCQQLTNTTYDCGDYLLDTSFGGEVKAKNGAKPIRTMMPVDNAYVYVSGSGLQFSVAVLPGPALLEVQDPLLDSLFTKLFFYESGGKYFTGFSDKTSIFGERIIIWKTNWNALE